MGDEIHTMAEPAPLQGQIKLFEALTYNIRYTQLKMKISIKGQIT
jgi:hypothetical protein